MTSSPNDAMQRDVLLAHEHLRPVLESRLQRYRLVSPSTYVVRPGDVQPIAVVADGSVPFDRTIVQRFPRIRLIAAVSTGYDGIGIGWARRLGIAVTHSYGGNHEDVADHAIGAILACRRGLLDADRMVRSGGWTRAQRPISRSVAGLRVGIVGLGRIGRAVALRAAALRMAPRWWGPRPKPGVAWPRAANLLELARGSDVVVIAVPANGGTRHLISAEVLHALGADGLLVNVARGQVVDEAALIGALRSGALGAAALDVFEEEPTPAVRWQNVPHTLLTPHIAGVTDRFMQCMSDQVVANLDAFFAERSLVTPVQELMQERVDARSLLLT